MEPQLSIILATDSFQTIRPVLERLRAQLLKDVLEVVLVTPAPVEMEAARACLEGFAAVRIVQDPVHDLAPARAAGVRAATAPLVFIGETHSFPHPDFAGPILSAFRDPRWTVVIPALSNANPRGALSWSGFLSDYGRWAEGLPGGQIAEAPVYNAAYRRAVLLDCGDRLSVLLSQSDELALLLQAKSLKVLFEPRSLVGHANLTQPHHWFLNRFLAGILIAGNRARRWSVARRVVYVGGAFLIPLVILRRLLPGVRETARRVPLPAGTMFAIVFATFARSGGEMLGYAGLLWDLAARRIHRYEVHKLKFLGRDCL